MPDDLHKLRELPTDLQLHVLQMLREVVGISEAKQEGAGGLTGCDSHEAKFANQAGNYRHDEVIRCPKVGAMILLGYSS